MDLKSAATFLTAVSSLLVAVTELYKEYNKNGRKLPDPPAPPKPADGSKSK